MSCTSGPFSWFKTVALLLPVSSHNTNLHFLVPQWEPHVLQSGDLILEATGLVLWCFMRHKCLRMMLSGFWYRLHTFWVFCWTIFCKRCSGLFFHYPRHMANQVLKLHDFRTCKTVKSNFFLVEKWKMWFVDKILMKRLLRFHDRVFTWAVCFPWCWNSDQEIRPALLKLYRSWVNIGVHHCSVIVVHILAVWIMFLAQCLKKNQSVIA